MSVSAENPSVQRGLFIVFEGGDGCGKSTHSRLLADRIGALHTREPGGTAIGRRIREVVLDPAHPELADRTEALLMAADRAQHVAERILPTLESGRHVVSDRFVASSLAYQGVGRGLGIDDIGDLNQFATGGLSPDLVLLLDIEPELAEKRMGADLDRIESSGSALAEIVRETYLTFAANQPDRWIVIDAAGSVEDVARRIDAAVREQLSV